MLTCWVSHTECTETFLLQDVSIEQLSNGPFCCRKKTSIPIGTFVRGQPWGRHGCCESFGWSIWACDLANESTTLPETNSSHLKMDDWNTTFLLGWPIFRCYVSFRECTPPVCWKGRFFDETQNVFGEKVCSNDLGWECLGRFLWTFFFGYIYSQSFFFKVFFKASQMTVYLEECLLECCCNGNLWPAIGKTTATKPLEVTGFFRESLKGMASDTVDGQNPAPPRMMIIPLFIGF